MKKRISSPHPIRCSFCGRGQEEVARLVSGPSVYICSECVRLCNDILEGEPDQGLPMPRESLPKPADIRAAQQETFERKWKTQPSGMRCAGCVFMNPAGGAAGRLIDEAGLKGLRVGGAVVSDLHANFILNDRGATSEDVEELIEVVRERVADSAGVTLELEIEIVGRP